MGFKLGYLTYALKMLAQPEAFKLIKDAGFEVLEICLIEDWPNSPLNLSLSQQYDL